MTMTMTLLGDAGAVIVPTQWLGRNDEMKMVVCSLYGGLFGLTFWLEGN